MTENAMTDQNQLAVIATPATQTGMPLLSPGLSPLLTDPRANDDGSAVRAIARNRALLAEAEALLPVLEAACEPASMETLMVILLDESVSYDIGAKGLSDPEWASFWSAYLRTLEGISAPCLREAFVMWNRNHIKPNGEEAVRFYPRHPQLYALATEAKIKLGMMRHRARAALAHRPPAPPKVMDKMTKAEMIEKGWMNEDGSVNLGPAIPKTIVVDEPRRSAMHRAPDHVEERWARMAVDLAAPLTDGEEAV